jgi:hypothetical protein
MTCMRVLLLLSSLGLFLLDAASQAGRPCKVSNFRSCPQGQFCAAEWREGICPEEGACQETLPVPKDLVLSLPFPAGERMYCAKGILRWGKSTHSACDPATRFALDFSGTAADRPHFVLAPAAGVAHVQGGCTTSDLNRQAAPDPCNHGFGNLVRVQHSHLIYSQVAHLSSILVQDGERVERGDVLGIEGNTGNAGAKHIHWSLHLGSARARMPSPTIPFLRLRLRLGGREREVSSFDLPCGDFQNDPNPVPASLLESENRPRRFPRARFGYLTWLDEAVQAIHSRDPAARRRAISTLRDHYSEEPTAPYWIGVAYLTGGDAQTALEELWRARHRAEAGVGPPWLRPWCLIMLAEIFIRRKNGTEARSLLHDALSTPGPDPTGFRMAARDALTRVNAP